MRHDAYARLALEYPDATVHRDALPWATVRAYRETFVGEPMPSTIAVCMKSALNRARQVAVQSTSRKQLRRAEALRCAVRCGDVETRWRSSQRATGFVR